MRKRSIFVVVATGAFALVSILGGVASGAPKATVKLGDNFFSPTEKTVTVGTKVRFNWTGGNRHNIDQERWPRRGFRIADDAGKRRQLSQKFTKAGTYRLICTIHPATMEAEADGALRTTQAGSASMLKSSVGAGTG